MNRFIFLIIGIAIFTVSSLFAETRIIIGMGGTPNSACENVSSDAKLTGSIALLSVQLSHTEKYEFTGIPLGKPEWLTLEFSYDLGDNEPFLPSSELYNLLNPSYVLRADQIDWNRIITEGKQPSARAREIYFFTCMIPEELANNRICVRINESTVPYEIEASVKGALHPYNHYCIDIIDPCTIADRNRTLASHIITAYVTEKSEYAIAFTDSLLVTGWIDDEGLYYAIASSNSLKQPRKALSYLDLMYKIYGYIDPLEKDVADNPTSYTNQRQSLERQIAEQEQQEKSDE
jgi:hypothetical protein